MGKPRFQVEKVIPVAITLERPQFTEPQPISCKWCGSKDLMKYGVRRGVQEYICVACRRKFSARGNAAGMRFTVDQIGSALAMFYDGMSLSAISRQLEQAHHIYVNPSTVYRWVLRYTTMAVDATKPLILEQSERWAVDETVVKVGGNNLWFWDIIDDRTRFLLASHLSRKRTIRDVVTVMDRAKDRTGGTAPRFILSDRLRAYDDGIDRVFGGDAKHIQSFGFTDEINNNLIERFHGTIKQRTKVLRGFKTMETAKLILEGFLVNYNFFRPHMALGNRAPAYKAGMKSPFQNWIEVVRLAQ